MKRYEHTSMGGAREAFQTTEWHTIKRIAAGGEASSKALVNDLLKRYWKPVYCYLRRKGYDNEQAKDLTQGFFYEVVLCRKLIQRADRAKGRFRRFLLVALERYLKSVHRKNTARKRTRDHKPVQLEHMEPGGLPEPLAQLTPEQSFDYAWASALLDRLLAEVEADCHAHGMTAHWNVFHDRVLLPIMEDVSAPSLSEMCRKHGIEDVIKASNMIITVNRRFQATLKRYLRQSVASDDQIEDEFRELMQMFSPNGAG